MSTTHSTTTTTTSTRKIGQVKFFNSTKGYGFILPKEQEGFDTTEDVFVHHTAIKNEGGFRSLCQDEVVEYELIKGPKGMQAILVTGIGGGPVKGNLADAGQSYGQQLQYYSHQDQRYIKHYKYQKNQLQYHPDYYNFTSYYHLQGYNPTQPPTFVYHHHSPYQYPQQQQGLATTPTTTTTTTTTTVTTPSLSPYYLSSSSNPQPPPLPPPPPIIHYPIHPSYIPSPYYSYSVSPLSPSSPNDFKVVS